MSNLTFKLFWIRQFSKIKKEGFEAIVRKLKTVSRRFAIFISSLLVTPIILIVRVIKPLLWIRFGWFDGPSIGHFSFDVEYYLAEKKLDLHPVKATDIFFYRLGKPANTFFSKLTKRNLFIRNWVEPLFVANKSIPGGGQHTILPAREICGSRDVKGLFRQTGIQLTFTNVENQIGQSFLESIGIISKQKFVCMTIRDSAYLKNAGYHNYRDVDISTLKEAALALAEKGYWVFRMGKVVHESFKSDHPHILDYANIKSRSDFLDIWLMANCFFCISTGTGLDEVARIFRRP